MDNVTVIAAISIGASVLCMVVGSIMPAFGEMKVIMQALGSIAQQPDEASTLSRTLFIGLAMIESLAIYCFVISIILIFANPFWNHIIAKSGG
ncbi:MAG TPA: F0F1 ATP synthase subunit C [Bryobacteraceae bacterium]|jgi:F-type H+-transporting ATPase subunit c|nr:F0F1 ATP synthase subunit C [Bryobacteraceae bacterium]